MSENKHNYYFNSAIQFPPPVVGYYCMDGLFHFGMIKKPNWFHRLMVRCILGWKWKKA